MLDHAGGVFVDRLAPGAQCHEQPAHLSGGGLTLEQHVKGGFRLGAGQGPAGGGADQRLQSVAHAGTFIVSRKFWISA